MEWNGNSYRLNGKLFFEYQNFTEPTTLNLVKKQRLSRNIIFMRFDIREPKQHHNEKKPCQ